MQLDFFKVVTILYALVGIPLMFIYMANIGTILATSFKYTYSKMCRYKINVVNCFKGEVVFLQTR